MNLTDDIEVFVETGKETCGIRYTSVGGNTEIKDIVAGGLPPEKAASVAASAVGQSKARGNRKGIGI